MVWSSSNYAVNNEKASPINDAYEKGCGTQSEEN